MPLRSLYILACGIQVIFSFGISQAFGSIAVDQLIVQAESAVPHRAANADTVLLAKALPVIKNPVILTDTRTSSAKLLLAQTAVQPGYRGNAESIGNLTQSDDAIAIDELIVLTGDQATTGELFGMEPGNIHASLELKGEYTDNVYNIRENTESNLLTTISPRFWLVTPKADRLPVQLSSYNTSIGGIRYSLPATGSFDRFQAYILGGLDYSKYSINSDLDYTAWTAEAMVQYNLPVGISFRIHDKFTKSRDRFDIGSFNAAFYDEETDQLVVSEDVRTKDFISNQAVAYMNVDLRERFSVLFSYVNFYLDYDDSQEEWLDRNDDVWVVDLGYHYSPKTSVFLEGKYATSQYDTAEYNDSSDLFFYGGVKWHKSIKTQLMIKGGYQVRSYENKDIFESGDNGADRFRGYEDIETFVIESWFNYRFSDKTKMSLQLAKSIEASETILSAGKNTLSAVFYVDHQFSERLRSHFSARYEHYDYEDFSLDVENRTDEILSLQPAINYDFREWLSVELGYSFEKRLSNINLYEFTTNTVFLNLITAF